MSQTAENMEGFEGNSITTRAPKAVEKGTKPADWSITLPNPVADIDLEKAVADYGDKVLELFKAKFVVDFQSAVRTMAVQGRTDEEIAEMMSQWKPGTKVEAIKQSPEAAILKNFGSMSPEDQASIMAQLKALAGQV